MAVQDDFVMTLDSDTEDLPPPPPTKQAKGKQKAVEEIGSLAPIAKEETSSLTMAQLVAKYGDTLRIAVDHETSFAAITGSHIRVRLSNLIYEPV